MAKDTVNSIRKLLADLNTSERQSGKRKISGDEMEQILHAAAEQARHLPREGIVEALDAAVGNREVSIAHQWLILAPALDQPAVVNRVGEWLASQVTDAQKCALQIVAENKLVSFVPQLNPLIDSAGPAQIAAIVAAGLLQSPINLASLLLLADRNEPGIELPLVLAISNFAEGGRPFLQRVFETIHPDEERPKPWGDRLIGLDDVAGMTEFIRWQHARNTSDRRKRTRVVAAGGLAKLGMPEAIFFLLEMLDDPDESGRTSQYYGQSRNAAEALCHAFGWSTEPRAGLVDRVRELAVKRFGA